MNPEDFFSFVVDILEHLSEERAEITYRSAISRLYYGIFHWIQQQYHIHVPKHQINRCHAYVKEVIAENVASEDILDEYTTLEQKRIEADYFLDLRITKADYELALRAKETLIRIIIENPEFLGFTGSKRELFRRLKKEPL